MVPDPARIAERDALRLAQVLAEMGGHGRALAGGWMACDEPGSWARFAAGLGIARPVTSEDVQELIAFYDDAGQPAEVQATPYQDASLFRELAAAGFALRESEIVLQRDLAGPVTGARCALAPLEFSPVDPADDASRARFVDVHLQGFHPEGEVPAGMKPIAERVARNPRVTLWIIEHEGRAVASGGLEVFENFAVFVAGSVLPEFRRRGLHAALFERRLRHGRELDLDYALIGSRPGGPTERNALRAGFVPAFTQLCLRRQPVPEEAR